jgi:hypothetical protein
MSWSAALPARTHTFSPSMCQSPPRRTARVATREGSKRPVRSAHARATTDSPETMGASQRACWSLFPANRRAWPATCAHSVYGSLARVVPSCSTMSAASTKLPPKPPTSMGIAIPSQPSSPICRHMSREKPARSARILRIREIGSSFFTKSFADSTMAL